MSRSAGYKTSLFPANSTSTLKVMS